MFSRSVIIFTILSLSRAIPGIAQVDRSSLTGTVTDPSGRLLGQTTSLLWRIRPSCSVKGCQTTLEDMRLLSFRREIHRQVRSSRLQDSDLRRCGAGGWADAHPGCGVAGIRRRGACGNLGEFGADGPQHRRSNGPDREKAGQRTATEWPQLVGADGIRPRRHRHRWQQPAVDPVRWTRARRQQLHL